MGTEQKSATCQILNTPNAKLAGVFLILARAAYFTNYISFCLLHSIIFVDLLNMTIS